MDVDDDYEDVAADEHSADAAKPKIASKIQRGRGFNETENVDGAKNGIYDKLRDDTKNSGVKSIEGWVIFVTNVHEEANEEDMVDTFAEFGDVKGIQMNLDRRTGFVKGYAAIEYGKKAEAEQAIVQMDGAMILNQKVRVDWAFIAPRTKARRYVGGRGGRRR